MKVTVYSHNYAVTGHDQYRYRLLKTFALKHAELDYRAMKNPYSKVNKPTIKKIYATYTDNKREFRFHINTLDSFLEMLKLEGVKDYEIIRVPLYSPLKVGLSLMAGFIPRDDQAPLIQYLIDDGTSKILNLQTGFGKTFCALAGAVQVGGKILISVESRFFNLWQEAFDGKKKVVDVDFKKEVMFIQGSKDLKALMELALTDNLKEEKVFIVSARTMAMYFEAYERSNGNLAGLYPVAPIELMETLDIATRIKDEVHLSLHANFKEELYLHCGKSFSLSATLEDGSFKDKIFGIMFPKNMRSPETDYMKYIDVTALLYTFERPDAIVTTRRGSSDYSHNAFEQWLLGNKRLYNNYAAMVTRWIEETFLPVRVDKQRACIFVASVEMATAIIETLRKAFPHVHFERYAASAGDVYEDAKKADVLITTTQSFGTGFDLEDLLMTLMTNSIRSQTTNIQVLGRLRKMKNYPDTTPKFYYLVCADNAKQMAYHEEKKIQFYGKVKNHNVMFLKTQV